MTDDPRYQAIIDRLAEIDRQLGDVAGKLDRVASYVDATSKRISKVMGLAGRVTCGMEERE